MTLPPIFLRYKKWIIGIISIFVLILLILIIKKPAAYDPSEIITADSRTIVESVMIGGRVRTSDRAELAFNSSGRIASLKVNEGSKVKKGAVLATLEMGSLYAQREDANASLAIAKSDASTNNNEQDTLVENAYQALLSSDLTAYAVDQYSATPPTLSGTYSGTQEGEYRLEMYNSNAESGYSYKYSGIESGTGTAWVDAPLALGTRGLYIQFDASSNYSNTEWVVPVPNTRSSSYVTLRSAYDQAKAARDRVLGANQSSQVSARTEALIRQAEARIKSINAQINQGVITAPFAGTVGGITIEKGENITAGAVALTLVGQEQFEIILNVPEIDIAKITLDDTVLVTLDAYPEISWDGVIQKIAPVETYVDGVPIYETTVVITGADERIRSGMSAQATIETARADNVIALPSYTLTQKKNTATVRVYGVDGKIEERTVVLGLRGSDGYVEIKEGIRVGEQVIGSLEK